MDKLNKNSLYGEFIKPLKRSQKIKVRKELAKRKKEEEQSTKNIQGFTGDFVYYTSQNDNI